MTAANLRSHTSKDLAQMAKKEGVAGWHSMRKEELVQALVKVGRSRSRKKPTKAARKPGAKVNSSTKSKNPRSEEKSRTKIARQIQEERLREENLKNLALANANSAKQTIPTKDRAILIVRDSYWLQAYWEITKETVSRARVALADAWHHAKPIIRVLELSDEGATNTVEKIVKEIPIHGGVRNWYIDVPNPPKRYRIAIGYATADNRFHLITKSNCVQTPAPGSESCDDNWVDIKGDYEKYYAMSGGYESKPDNSELQFVFESKIRRPINAPAFVRLGSGIGGMFEREFPFEVDAQMVVFGSTIPQANVTIGGEPVKVKEDGTFSVKMALPDKRQVLPVVASSRDGTEQRTTVLAVERNTKVMEPISRDISEVE